jgi:hypothetical protein
MASLDSFSDVCASVVCRLWCHELLRSRGLKYTLRRRRCGRTVNWGPRNPRELNSKVQIEARFGF